MIALGSEEGIRHATADDQLIGFGEQGLNDEDLVADLRSAENGNIGMFGIRNRAPEIFQFLFHQEAGDGGQESGNRLPWMNVRDGQNQTRR